MSAEPLKIWRSPLSAFGRALRDDSDREDETLCAVEQYTDEELAQISAAGFNAIWVHGILHHMVREEIFPEFGSDASRHIAAMRTLIARAARYGLSVLLYMQPPRALPADHQFFAAHPDLAGHRVSRVDDDGKAYEAVCLCTTQPVVLEYVRNACRTLAEALPELGGVILITASEYLNHCLASSGRTIDEHGKLVRRESNCPRCRDREPAAVVGELLHAIRNGLRDGGGAFPILAWNWSWSFYYDPPCLEILERLPKDVVLLSGFERGGRQDYCGRRDVVVDEYSLSYAGPSEQFAAMEKAAETLDLSVAAKLQFGTTHELATVVNLPLMENIHRKAAYVRTHQLAGFMGCWNFGNQLSANTAGFNFFLSEDCPADADEALAQFAREYFPGCDAPGVVGGWQGFTRAMRHYPFSIPFLYMGPLNYTLSYILEPGPLSGLSAGRSWLQDERGDDLSAAFDIFPAEAARDGLSRLADEWDTATSTFCTALTSSQSETAVLEAGNARICGAIFRSGANTIGMYLLKRSWDESRREQWRRLTSAETELLKKILPDVRRDSRQGYHAEAHSYMFSPELIEKKISALESWPAR